MVSVDGNLYSVPDTTRRRPVEVHSTAHELRILENGQVVAVHPVLDGRGLAETPQAFAADAGSPPGTARRAPRPTAKRRAKARRLAGPAT